MYLLGFVVLSILVIFALIYLYWYFKKSYMFFEKRDIKYLNPTFVFGNMKDVFLLQQSMVEAYANLYRRLEPLRYGGIFAGTKPIVLIRDPLLVKDILIKDFAYFSDRGWHVDESYEPLSRNLFFMKGNEWKSLRTKLTGAFTGMKMKTMFSSVNTCGEKLSQVIDKTPSGVSFDIKDLSMRYMTDVIGCCILGLETNALKDANSEFTALGRKVMKFRLRSLVRMLQFNIPVKVNRFLELTFTDMKIQNIFAKIVDEAIEYREKNNITRNDILDLMIALKHDKSFGQENSNPDEDQEKLQDTCDRVKDEKEVKSNLKITNELLAAQAFIFFFAAFANASTNLCYALMELSKNSPVQDKVRQEISDVLSNNNGQITYEALSQMTYTDMVMQEALRKYPSPGVLLRKALKNYKIPNSDNIIPAGTSIAVSLYGIHMDENYYENPEQFRPERFTQEEISTRPNYTYLPFGEGPRFCIGMRFAKMIVKIGLIHALKDFSYRVSPEMKFPLKLDRNFGLMAPCDKVLLQRGKIE